MSEQQKIAAAKAAVELVKGHRVIGVGTGSTVNYFIEALAICVPTLDAAVASSEETAQRLRSIGMPVVDLNTVSKLPIYVDGADEINHHLQMVKGGGGALTREKIIAAVADKVVCIAHQSKYVLALGAFPLPVEVIPMARSYVARELVKLGGSPVYREGFVSDNGHLILDVYDLKIHHPIELEETINNIAGVVTNGLFAARPADVLLLGTEDAGVTRIDKYTQCP